MLHLQSESSGEVGVPFFKGLSCQSLNQVDADVLESRVLAVAYRLKRLDAGVPAVEQAELVRVEGLYADTEAVDGQGAEFMYFGESEVVRIGFESDLRLGDDVVCGI